jgi:hypothetical protein
LVAAVHVDTVETAQQRKGTNERVSETTIEKAMAAEPAEQGEKVPKTSNLKILPV